jgi:tryptophan-rich sensory protein
VEGERKNRPVQGALLLFGIQLVLNGLWSYFFFGLNNPGLAFIEIVVLWAAIASTLAAFWQRRRLAGLLLVPYLSWVSFAVYLNFELWRLNRIAV